MRKKNKKITAERLSRREITTARAEFGGKERIDIWEGDNWLGAVNPDAD